MRNRCAFAAPQRRSRMMDRASVSLHMRRVEIADAPCGHSRARGAQLPFEMEKSVTAAPRSILIMGLPGAGKTALAMTLAPRVNAVHFNADEVRQNLNKEL